MTSMWSYIKIKFHFFAPTAEKVAQKKRTTKSGPLVKKNLKKFKTRYQISGN